MILSPVLLALHDALFSKPAEPDDAAVRHAG